ncbi:MAG: Ppx/GppA family phosphatase [Pyrinomonadaceae bacterium MAG19_C2-C3]|nr:Ppx/GppA family phosphatase [Pyrinomonadaceae bacterium MAG19_C2-C3]
MKLAAIDIGSNSIKLIVVEAATSDDFQVLAREKETVRLGHDTLRDRHLAPEAITRAADAIKRFASIANSLRVERIITIATAAVREADNAHEFVQEIGKRTGVHTEVLSGAEEARLIGLAASRGCALTVDDKGRSAEREDRFHLNIDIGGGSTELSLMRDGEPFYLASVNIGAVGLTERLITSDPIAADELQNLQDTIDATFQNPVRELKLALDGARWQRMTGTSGTIIAIGEALRTTQNADVIKDGTKRIAGKTNETKLADFLSIQIEEKQLDRFNALMTMLGYEQRRGVPGISNQRGEIIIAGGQILAGAMRSLGATSLQTCDWALREGVIVDWLREMEAESRPPVPDRNDPRLRGVHLLGTQFRYEQKHARHVAYLAERMFDDLIEVHGFNRHQRTMLAAAALLHDIGYLVAHDPHHKHSHYIIKHAELTGFSEGERQIIALIARYHRRALPKERHTDFAALTPENQNVVWRLGGILRLAEAFDRSHDRRVRDVKCRVEGRTNRTIQMRLISSESCRNELRAASTARDMFEQAFASKATFKIVDKPARASRATKRAVKIKAA